MSSKGIKILGILGGVLSGAYLIMIGSVPEGIGVIAASFGSGSAVFKSGDQLSK